tara:strand:+ start:137 stop:277 length:141 start_codon:yes stop_codon:yes gene_type:complete
MEVVPTHGVTEGFPFRWIETPQEYPSFLCPIEAVEGMEAVDFTVWH